VLNGQEMPGTRVYEALRTGKVYALRQLKGARLRLDEFYVQGSGPMKSFSGEIASIPGNHPPKVFCSVTTEDNLSRQVELKIISDGKIIKIANGKTPLKVEFVDNEYKGAGQNYYRLEINDEFSNRIISNPISQSLHNIYYQTYSIGGICLLHL